MFLKGYPLEAKNAQKNCRHSVPVTSFSEVKYVLKGYPLEAKNAPKNWN